MSDDNLLTTTLLTRIAVAEEKIVGLSERIFEVISRQEEAIAGMRQTLYGNGADESGLVARVHLLYWLFGYLAGTIGVGAGAWLVNKLFG
jgi:hypothetical protein